ncbi:hypothetical protein L596_029883 [Steinernema carpocapsae]|uniref:Potassium channel domain-containing protein n=1 Tax=Steinernema carpocapsae TaxID=34508 RepID=A0A4U5LR46_STECR|nr:hypothetical protein L596_029883 [Steinernema carpocapsae]
MITQYSRHHTLKFQKAKPFTLHCSLLFLVLLYAFLGGLIFNKLEREALRSQKETLLRERTECVAQVSLYFLKRTCPMAPVSSLTALARRSQEGSSFVRVPGSWWAAFRPG